MTPVDISWIAAVLTPRDLAPHPNFGEEAKTPAANLASLLAPWGRLPRGPFDPGDSSPEDQFLEACRQSMTFGTVDDGARTLSRWVHSSFPVDVGRSAAAALLASVAFCELDEHDLALDLLSATVDAVRAVPDGPDTQLALAAILQQRALRLFEIGESGEGDAAEVASLVGSIDFAKLTPFQLSQSVSWQSEDTCRDIADALADAARSHLAGLRDALSGSWQEIVRARPSFLLLKEGRRRADGYEEYLTSDFESAVGSGTWRFGGSPRGDLPLYQALFFTELLGHPLVRARRSELAVVRFLSSEAEKDVVLQE